MEYDRCRVCDGAAFENCEEQCLEELRKDLLDEVISFGRLIADVESVEAETVEKAIGDLIEKAQSYRSKLVEHQMNKEGGKKE